MTWDWISPGLMWFLLGVLLLLVELMTPGVLAVFFAAGAWVVAVLFWLGWVESFAIGLGIFLVVSVALLLGLRRRFVPIVKRSVDPAQDTDAELDDFRGLTARVIEPIDADLQTGTVELRGTLWEARADRPIAGGTVVQILSRNNLTLNVKPVKE